MTAEDISDKEKKPEQKDEELKDELYRKGKIETTLEETEGFFIVKSILREVVKPNRVFQRDTLSYFGILLDDNNRKPICRLYFSTPQKYIGIIVENKKEIKYKIDDLNDIYKYADQLKKTISFYEISNKV